MAKGETYTGTYLKIADRRPFILGMTKLTPGEIPNVRDMYLVENGNAVMSGVDIPITRVQSIHKWAIGFGIRIVYEPGTTDETKRLPSELDGIR